MEYYAKNCERQQTLHFADYTLFGVILEMRYYSYLTIKDNKSLNQTGWLIPALTTQGEFKMTKQLSDKDKKKMKEVFNETPEEAIRRQQFWANQPKQEFKVGTYNFYNFCPHCGRTLDK